MAAGADAIQAGVVQTRGLTAACALEGRKRAVIAAPSVEAGQAGRVDTRAETTRPSWLH